MVIDEKELIEDLYPIMMEQVKKDFNDGLFDDHLLTLSNMSSGLSEKNVLSETKLLEIWVNYRINYQIQKFYAKQPEMFGGFKRINGEEHIRKVLELGGVFVSFQYGNHRFNPLALGKKISSSEQYLNRIVDTDSYKIEKQDMEWSRLYQECKVDEIISNHLNNDPKLSQIMSKRESLYFYLDGEAGFDEDDAPVNVNFLGGKIKAPSSIFRLAVKFHKPVCFLMAEQDETGQPVLTAYEPVWLHDKNVENTVQVFYSIFEDILLKQPELWKKWDQPRKSLPKVKTKDTSSGHKVDVLNRFGTHGLNIQSGEIYQIVNG